MKTMKIDYLKTMGIYHLKTMGVYHWFDSYGEVKNRRLAFQDALMDMWSLLRKINEEERKKGKEYDGECEGECEGGFDWLRDSEGEGCNLKFRMYPVVDVLEENGRGEEGKSGECREEERRSEEWRAERLKFIQKIYGNNDGDLYWTGKKYESVEELVMAIWKSKWIVEMEIGEETGK